MTDATRNQLEQAYRLIQKDDLDKAIAILRPITASQPNNADAWWLMANAVTEPEEAYAALKNVLRVNPTHGQAKELLTTLEDEYPQLTVSSSAAASDLEDNTSFDDLFGSSPEPASSNSGFSSRDLDDLLGSSSSGSAGLQEKTQSDTDLDSFFSGSDDLFANSEPGFVQDEVLEPEPEKPGRRGDKKAKAEQEKKPARQPKEPAPKKVRLAPEPVPEDPLELERRANRRPNRS